MPASRSLTAALLVPVSLVLASRRADLDFELNQTECDLTRYSDAIWARYKDRQYAGAGANGCVYVAKDSLTNNVEVAIKFSKKPGRLQSWKDECKRSMQLHEAACKKGGEALELAERYLPVCLEVKGTDEAPYMVMHSASGEGIGQARRSIPFESRKSVFAQLVGALAAVHGVGLSHNDLHEQNVVILRGSGSLAAFIDFGEVVPLAQAQYLGGYKQDENLLAREASKLAKCPKEAEYPFLSEKISAQERDARETAFEQCLKDEWCKDDATCNDEFFKAFHAVINEAWEQQQHHPKNPTPKLVMALYHTAFIQKNQPALAQLFPLLEHSSCAVPEAAAAAEEDLAEAPDSKEEEKKVVTPHKQTVASSTSSSTTATASASSTIATTPTQTTTSSSVGRGLPGVWLLLAASLSLARAA